MMLVIQIFFKKVASVGKEVYDMYMYLSLNPPSFPPPLKKKVVKGCL